MKLFDTFTKQAPNKVFFSILLGTLAGVSYAFLIPIVLSAINSNPADFIEPESTFRTVMSLEVSHYKIAVLFLCVCVFILTARTLSQVMLEHVAIDATTNLRISLYKRVMSTSTDVLEKLGSAKLIATIGTDVGRIVAGAIVVPEILMNLVTIAGLLGFLVFLNIDVFWFVIGAVLFGIVTYQIPMFISDKYFTHSRKKSDELQESIRGLIYGSKELKLNHVKSEAYLKDVLLSNEYEVRRADKVGNSILRVAVNYGDMISFFVIGIVSFIFINYHAVSSAELVGVVMVLLYITGPVAVIIASIPQLVLARVSLNKVSSIFAEIPPENINQDVRPIPQWQKVIFKDVCYQYNSAESSDGFKMGPVNFSINKSEITFIVGGNGSGKSTLSKLVTLHHAPTSGVISFGPTDADAHNIKSCRQAISSIYSDYYLFDRILIDKYEDKKAEIERYLVDLALDKKVTIENGRFSTLSLSDGQKRRLALLISFLDDKQLYLFDEWAADQDPMFKEFFYYKVLPELKQKGKAVVVISHDDRYFDVADKILIMEDGQLVNCITDRHTINEKTLNRTMLVSTEPEQREIA